MPDYSTDPQLDRVLQQITDELYEIRDQVERRRTYTPNKFKGQLTGSDFTTTELPHHGDYGARTDDQTIQFNIAGTIEVFASVPPSGAFAPSPHDLDSAHHTGTLADAQFPNALLRDGSRSLLDDLAVADGKTIDGVDISAFKSVYDAHIADADAHHTGFTRLYGDTGTATPNDQDGITIASGDGIVTSVPSANTVRVAATIGSGLTFSSGNIVHATGDFGDVHTNYTEHDQSETITGAKWTYNNAVDIAGTLQHPNYISQSQRWRVDALGNADFRYIYTDELHAKAFIADIEQALAGEQSISKSVAILARDFVVPAVSGTGTLYVEDLPGQTGTMAFASGDWVRLRVFQRGVSAVFADVWGTVSAYVDQGDGTQAWTYTVEDAGPADIAVGQTIYKGSVVKDYGTSGDGYWRVTALDAYGPYAEIKTWDTDPSDNLNHTLHVRMGNLDGIGTIGGLSPSGWGLYTDNAYLQGALEAAGGAVLINDNGMRLHEGGAIQNKIRWTLTDGTTKFTVHGDLGTSTMNAYLQTDRNTFSRIYLTALGMTQGTNDAQITVRAEVTPAISFNVGSDAYYSYNFTKDTFTITLADLSVVSGSASIGGTLAISGDLLANQSGLDIGTSGIPFEHIYVTNLHADTVEGATMSGTQWEINSNGGVIDVHYNGTSRLDVVNQYTGQSANMSVEGSLRVGGTGDPTATLDVDGNIDVSGTVDGVDVGSHAGNINAHHSKVHVLDGSDHTVSGLTAGQVLKATAAATFAWGQLQHSDLGGVNDDDHHDPVSIGTGGLSTKLNLSTQVLTLGAINHSDLSNISSDQHITHSGVTLTAGNGLTGGGDISASRTFAVDYGNGLTMDDGASGSKKLIHATGDLGDLHTNYTEHDAEEAISENWTFSKNVSVGQDVTVTGNLTALGGIHVGGTSDPGDDNLLVDGDVEISETSTYKQDGEQVIRIAKGTETYYTNTYAGMLAGSNTRRQSAFGYAAGFGNTGTNQSAFGHTAGHSNSGVNQSAFGYYAGRSNSGDHQSAFGRAAGNSNTGADQSAFGYHAGRSNTGTNQSAFGCSAGRENEGVNQSAFGYTAGHQNTGDRVTGVGYYATRENEGDDVVAIGYEAGYQNTAANQFIVKQASVNATPLIQGDFSTGNVGIGTTDPGDFHSKANRLVIGAGTADEGVTIYSTTSGRIAFADGTTGDPGLDYGGSITYSHAYEELIFRVEGTDIASIDAAGLDITGALDISGGGAFGGSVDIVDGDLTVLDGSTTVFKVDESLNNVGIMTNSPDPQFALDVAGAIRGEYLIGPHAIQLSDAKMICHFDGSYPFETNFDVDTTGHLGQVATASNVIGRPGKFGKAVEIAEGTTNLVTNPVFENDTSSWSGYQDVSISRSTDVSYVGSASLKCTVSDSGGFKKLLANYVPTLTGGVTYTVQARVYVPSGWDGGNVYIDFTNYAGSSGSITKRWESSDPTDEWFWISATSTIDAGDTTGQIQVWSELNASDGKFIYVDAVQIEAKVYPTPFTYGEMPNSQWDGDGTAHANTSTRSGGYVRQNPMDLAGGSFTVLTWLKLSSDDAIGDRTIFGHHELNAQNKWAHYVVRNRKLHLGLYSNDLSGTTTLSGDQWYHAAFVYDKENLRQYLYLDGELENSRSCSEYQAYSPINQSIGVSPTSNSSHLNGWLDDFVIVQAAMDADEIRAIYESNAPVFAETSIQVWRSPAQVPIWVDEEGLWGRDEDGNASIGWSSVDSKSWGNKTLGAGDFLLGHDDSYLWWDADGDGGNGLLSTKGRIEASEGEIGGFTIGAESLYAGTGATRVQMDKGSGFWAGANARGDAPFSVTEAGVLTAESGTVGGWTLTATELHNTNIWLDADAKQIAINSQTYGNDGIQLEYNSGSPRAYIGNGTDRYFMYDGSTVTWKAANAELDSSGNVQLAGGTIGGWTIENDKLSAQVGNYTLSLDPNATYQIQGYWSGVNLGIDLLNAKISLQDVVTLSYQHLTFASGYDYTRRIRWTASGGTEIGTINTTYDQNGYTQMEFEAIPNGLGSQASMRLYAGTTPTLYLTGTKLHTGTTIYAGDYATIMGGVNIGSTADPGTSNLIVQGSAGIGTSPSYALHLEKNVDGYVAMFDNTRGDDGNGIIIRAGVDTNPNDVYIQFQDGNGTLVGRIIGNGAGSVIYQGNSDIRYKRVISTLDPNGALAALRDVDAIVYTGTGDSSGERDVGFSAQEFYRRFPGIASIAENGRYLMDYSKVSTVLWAATKSVDQRLVDAEATIRELQAKITELEGG